MFLCQSLDDNGSTVNSVSQGFYVIHLPAPLKQYSALQKRAYLQVPFVELNFFQFLYVATFSLILPLVTVNAPMVEDWDSISMYQRLFSLLFSWRPRQWLQPWTLHCSSVALGVVFCSLIRIYTSWVLEQSNVFTSFSSLMLTVFYTAWTKADTWGGGNHEMDQKISISLGYFPTCTGEI